MDEEKKWAAIYPICFQKTTNNLKQDAQLQLFGQHTFTLFEVRNGISLKDGDEMSLTNKMYQ